jgi:hypothetical protein
VGLRRHAIKRDAVGIDETADHLVRTVLRQDDRAHPLEFIGREAGRTELIDAGRANTSEVFVVRDRLAHGSRSLGPGMPAARPCSACR